MAEFERNKPGGRFTFGGIKTNISPDACPPGKYPFAQNVRGYNDDTAQSRPQMTQLSANPPVGGPVLSLEPNLLFYKVGNNIFYQGASFDAGYSANAVSMTPFRPDASPVSWDYVWDSTQCRKLSPGYAPVKTGIAEPQAPVDFQISNGFYYNVFAQNITAYTFNNTGGDSGAVRVNDSVAGVYQDPTGLPYYSISTANALHEYGVGERIEFGGRTLPWRIYDVIPGMIGPISIVGIYYNSGTTGRCTVVPYNTGVGEEATIQQEQAIASLRRGSLITFSGGETCYVLGVIEGPDGTISFEVVTASNHTTAETITGTRAITICTANGTTINFPPAPGDNINATSTNITLNSNAICTAQPSGGISSNPFLLNGSPFREDDYIHISVNVDNLSLLNEIKFLIDIGDGSFTKDFFYYSIRPSDIALAALNTLTQLGASQLVSQRNVIDEESASKGEAESSAQTSPGSGIWSDISFPIRAMTRVGADPTKSLLTMVNYQFLFNTLGQPSSPLCHVICTLDFGVSGGYALDIKNGNPVRYVIRGRSSLTGAKSNRCPEARYGVSPHRHQVTITLPTTSPDLQVDTWDVFRLGGSLEDYTLVGSAPLPAGRFDDYFSDLAIAGNPKLETDNYEPYPSIGNPVTMANLSAFTVIGTKGLIAFNAGQTPPEILRWLPGTILQVGQQAYTLWTRPTVLGGSYLLQLVENAGIISGTANVAIYEPDVAAQNLAFSWGPDNNGVIFSVGDSLRPGFVYHTKPKNPDATEDHQDELAPPTEALQNGVLIDQTSFCASASRWWRGFPGENPDGSIKYNWDEIPVGAGLAVPRGLCTDGEQAYFVAKDGIRATGGGASKNLTDADLYNLFPHEGVYPVASYSYNGQTIWAPDYTRTMQLNTANGFLFFDYQDANGIQRSLSMNLRTQAWCADSYAIPVTIHASIDSPPSATSVPVYAGRLDGSLAIENSNIVAGSGEQVSCFLATYEENGGDVRAKKIFGDSSLNLAPASVISVTPMFLGVAGTPVSTIAAGGGRIQPALSIGGQQIKRSFGLFLSWTDQGVPTILYSWQPSLIPQPEDTDDRFTDWYYPLQGKTGFWQGLRIRCDTYGQAKSFLVRDVDSRTEQQSFTITANGENVFDFSFADPFVAHGARIEPDSVPWRLFSIEWTLQSTPPAVMEWITQPSSMGWEDWGHIKSILIVYESFAPVLLTITCDGISPQPITLPSSGGQWAKFFALATYNKGQIYSYQLTSAAAFRVAQNDSYVGGKPWGSQSAYRNVAVFGAELGALAEV